MSENYSDSSTARQWWIALGLAGILPQLLAVVLAFQGSEYRFLAHAGGYAYAAAIFSFLGGVWWGQALSAPNSSPTAFILAVLPSLIAVALFLPWTLGWSWPDYSLMTIGLLIMLSPKVDRYLGMASRTFMRLRWFLSLSLGTLTIVLGMLALRQV